MAVRYRLDRKTRIAMTMLIVILLAGPVVALRNWVINAQDGSTVVASQHPTDDGLIRLNNGSTIHLHSQVVARKLSHWLDIEANAKPAFAIADSNFVPGSAEPTTGGRAQIAQLAQILDADPQLQARIFVTAGGGDSTWQLTRSRADRIRRELIARHVPAPKVTSAAQAPVDFDPDRMIDEHGRQSHLFVSISG
jgi:outer membrane protein OmpA-like peptidoglycan-associated protein